MIQLDKKQLGENLKRIRKNKGISRKDLADKSGLSESAIARYETNQREPRFSILCKISESLDMTVNELIDYEDIKINNLSKLERYYEQKKWEYENIECEHNIGNEGVLKGLEIAIQIMNDR